VYAFKNHISLNTAKVTNLDLNAVCIPIISYSNHQSEYNLDGDKYFSSFKVNHYLPIAPEMYLGFWHLKWKLCLDSMGGLILMHRLHRPDAQTAVTLTQLYCGRYLDTLLCTSLEDAHGELIRVKSKRCHRWKHPNGLYPHVHATDKLQIYFKKKINCR
jgi:hypothetical protein